MSNTEWFPNTPGMRQGTPAEPPAIPETDEYTLEDALYGSDDSVLKENTSRIREDLHRYSDAKGLTEAQRNAHALEIGHVFRDAKINADAFGVDWRKKLHAHLVDGLLNPPTQETKDQHFAESNRLLRQKYKDADARMSRVRQFMEARPAFKKLLDESGMANHPDFVMQLAENAYSLRVKPR